MSATRALRAHSSFRAALRLPTASGWVPTRPLNRRGYASSQHGKPSSDMPWLLTSLGVTLPLGYYIWSYYQPKPKSHGGHDEHAKKHDEEVKEDSSHEQKDEKEEPPSPDSKPSSKEMDDSEENQAAKLTDKPDSKRVDPTEK